MYRTLIPDVCYRNLFSWNTYLNNFSILCCLKDIVVKVTKKSPRVVLFCNCTWLASQNRKALASLIWPWLSSGVVCIERCFFFHQGSEGPQAFWTSNHVIFPPLKWKMYFLRPEMNFFPQPNFQFLGMSFDS